MFPYILDQLWHADICQPGIDLYFQFNAKTLTFKYLLYLLHSNLEILCSNSISYTALIITYGARDRFIMDISRGVIKI